MMWSLFRVCFLRLFWGIEMAKHQTRLAVGFPNRCRKRGGGHSLPADPPSTEQTCCEIALEPYRPKMAQDSRRTRKPGTARSSLAVARPRGEARVGRPNKVCWPTSGRCICRQGPSFQHFGKPPGVLCIVQRSTSCSLCAPLGELKEMEWGGSIARLRGLEITVWAESRSNGVCVRFFESVWFQDL